MDIDKIIRTIDKEIKELTKQISSSNNYTYVKIRWNRIAKVSRLNLMRAVFFRDMIMRQQKDVLKNIRYKHKTTLLKLRKISIENYLLKKTLRYHRNFKNVSYKEMIEKKKKKH